MFLIVKIKTNSLAIKIVNFHKGTTYFSREKEAYFMTIWKQDFDWIIAPVSFSDHFRRQLVYVLDSG